MEVGNYIVHDRDHGKTDILCPRQVSQFRRSWVGHEILFASLMILSGYLPHGGYYVTVLHDIRVIMEEGRALGAQDFFICGDISIELKLDANGQDSECWDSTDWHGLYGPVCRGGSKDEITNCNC